MLCERCHQNNATLYVSELIQGKMKESYLCNECAKVQNNISQSNQPTFEKFITGILEMALGSGAQSLAKNQTELDNLACPNCKLTASEFKKNGRFGCSTCYETFHTILQDALKKIQPSNEHTGKVPQRLVPMMTVKREIEKLKKDLKETIKQEEYEQAAKLRDQIKDLTKGGEEDD